jgi:hypothetical protein
MRNHHDSRDERDCRSYLFQPGCEYAFRKTLTKQAHETRLSFLFAITNHIKRATEEKQQHVFETAFPFEIDGTFQQWRSAWRRRNQFSGLGSRDREARIAVSAFYLKQSGIKPNDLLPATLPGAQRVPGKATLKPIKPEVPGLRRAPSYVVCG